MMNAASPLDRARLYAALSGPFKPSAAMAASGVDLTSDEALTVSAELAGACETSLPGDSGHWLLRGSVRAWVLGDQEDLAAALRWRAEQAEGSDGNAEAVGQALLGEGPFARDAILDRLTAIEKSPVAAGFLELERLVTVLEWAGRGPGFDLLERVRTAIYRREVGVRGDLLLQDGFDGRDTERTLLAKRIREPEQATPVRFTLILGMPAIGKSTLLEKAIRESEANPIVVRLDFDRAALDVRDMVGLTLEAVRQISAQLPQSAADLRTGRLQAATARQDTVKGAGRDRLPEGLANLAAEAVRSSGRPLLFVLDTLEALAARGGSHPGELFRWLDDLMRTGLSPMSVIGAARGVADSFLQSRLIGEPITLPGLNEGDAEKLVERLGVPPADRARILLQAAGNPLRVRLGSAIALAPKLSRYRNADTVRLGRSVSDLLPRLAGAAVSVARSVSSLTRRRASPANVDEALLERTLTSRMSDQRLARLVSPGLLMHHIGPEAISQVWAPAVGLPPLGDKEAEALFEQLKLQTWLMEPDRLEPGWLQSGAQIRNLLYPLLSRHPRAGKLHRLASEWLSGRREPWARAEALWHRLQDTRRPLPAIDPEVAAMFDFELVEELPSGARDAVRWARGERSSFVHEGVDQQAIGGRVDPRAVQDLALALQQSDPMEASFLYRQAFELTYAAPAEQEGDIKRAFLWRVGRWAEAKASLAERDSLRPDDEDLRTLPEDIALARLEMRAEFDFRRLVRGLRADEPLLRMAFDVFARGVKSARPGSSLAYALARVLPPDEFRISGRPDGALGALELWRRQRGDSLATALSASPVTPEAADIGLSSEAGPARRLAGLSPFAQLPSLMVRTERISGLSAHASAVMEALQRVAWPEAPQTSSFAVETLGEAGLLAEWLGMAALVIRDADVRLIAQAAERWRATAAGHWRYDRRPRGWAGPTDLDIVQMDRIDRALADPNAPDEAEALLEAWSLGRPLPAGLQRRLRKAVDRSERAPDAVGAALVRARCPSALVAPLTVLTLFNQTPWRSS